MDIPVLQIGFIIAIIIAVLWFLGRIDLSALLQPFSLLSPITDILKVPSISNPLPF